MPMMIRKVLCEDGIIRYARIFEPTGKKGSNTENQVLKSTELTYMYIYTYKGQVKEEKVREFESIFNGMSGEYFDRPLRLFGLHRRSPKAEGYVCAAIRTCEKWKIPVDLFIRCHFEKAKENPKYLYLSTLGSRKAAPRYFRWKKEQGGNENLIRQSFQLKSYDEMFVSDHRRFLLYRERGIADAKIFKHYASEFSTHYLASRTDFDPVQYLTGERLQEFQTIRAEMARLNIQQTRHYWAEVERLKCQSQRSISDTKAKSSTFSSSRNPSSNVSAT